MTKSVTRRTALASLACGLAALPLPEAASAAESGRRGRPALLALSGDLALVTGAGGNVLAARGPDGLLLVDGGEAGAGEALLRAVRGHFGRAPVHTLVNTHWHPDVTGLNERLGRGGTRIVAHENTRLWLSTQVRYQPDGPPVGPLPAAGLPTLTTYTTGSMTLGTEEVRYGYLPQAHTDGDLYVLFKRANVLVTGGAVAGNAWPAADWVTGGWINGTVAALKTLTELCDADTRVVTAHGSRLWTRADLEAERAILAPLADQLAKMLRAGMGPADVIAADPLKENATRYADAPAFLEQSFRSLWPRFAPDA